MLINIRTRIYNPKINKIATPYIFVDATTTDRTPLFFLQPRK